MVLFFTVLSLLFCTELKVKNKKGGREGKERGGKGGGRGRGREGEEGGGREGGREGVWNKARPKSNEQLTLHRHII